MFAPKRVAAVLMIGLLAAVVPSSAADATSPDAFDEYTGNLGVLLREMSALRGVTSVISVDQTEGDILRPSATEEDVAFFAYEVVDAAGAYEGFVVVDRTTDDTAVLGNWGGDWHFSIYDTQSETGETQALLVPFVSVAAGNAAAETCDAVGFAISEGLAGNPYTAIPQAYVNVGSYLVCGFLRIIDSDRQSFHAGGGCTSPGVTFWTTSVDLTGSFQCKWEFPYQGTWGYTRAIDLRPVHCTAAAAAANDIVVSTCAFPIWRVETLWPDGYDDRSTLSSTSPGSIRSHSKSRSIYFPRGSGYRATTAAFERFGGNDLFTGKITQHITVH